MDNVLRLVRDNSAANKKFADLVKKPSLGCHWRRFNMAVQNGRASQEAAIGSMYRIVVKLGNAILGIEPRKFTNFCPILLNQTQ